MDVLTNATHAKAVQVLLYHTLLISQADFLCGNCGDSALPHDYIHCKTCGVQWTFSAITYEIPTSLDEQAKLVRELLPSSLSFIGRIDAAGVHEAYLPLRFF